ncbi:MAG: serine hydrolase [Flavobacteriales bacterium]|nr:serine hydrolase [Flavobacteriales bacterium]NCA20666.1 serine hydrolase [Crocinitomicaceae bacterium]
MKLYLFILFTGLSTLSFGQSKQDKELVKLIDKSVSDNYKNFTPGCAVLIAKKGKVLLEKGYGTANLELNVPIKAEMVFRIGSITKQFTAMAILQLVDKGQITLTDSIQKFIKDFHFKGKTITIENLLTHTSGIKGYEQIDPKVPNAMRVDFSPKAVIDSLDKLSLEFDPNTRYNYSNSNYFLLGYIIEQVSGKSYQQYVKENIIGPAGLSSTFYESQTQLIPNRANGYSLSEGKYWNTDFISMSLVYSAGALRSTVSDLYKWHKALYEGKIVKKETFLKAIQPYKLADGKQIDYGYGFFNKTENGINSIGHGGAIDGFRAIEMYYPEQEIYITLLCNSESDNFERFFQSISNIILGIKTENEQKEIKLSGEILDSYIGTYQNEKYKVSIKIYMANGRIYGDLSNGTGSFLMFIALTETKFFLPDIQRVKTSADFVKENGKVTKLILTQEQPVEFTKIE